MRGKETVAVFENVVKWRKGRSIGIEKFSMSIQKAEKILVYGNSGMMRELYRVTVAVFENVVKWRKGRSIGIEKFSMSIQKAEKILVYGNSGMMRELYRVFAQLEKPDDGIMKIYGQLAYISTEFPLWNDLRVQDYLFLMLRDRKKKHVGEVIEMWKESLLWKKRTFQIQHLSDWEKEKLLYLMAFLRNPDILVIGNIGKIFTREEEKELWNIFQIQHLSDWEKEKLLYLMAFLRNPDILVIGNIGKIFTREEEKELWNMVDRYRSINHMAVLCVSEYKEEPYQFDCIYRVLNGKIVREGE